MSALLELVDLSVHERGLGRERAFVAVDGVTLTLERGGSTALIGESGSGAATLARTLVGLCEPVGGSIRFDGRELASLAAAERRALRRRIGIVFRDPVAALDPRQSLEALLAEPFEIHRIGDARERRARSFAVLEAVGLSIEDLLRHPHELSALQLERVCIARALAPEPELLILEEPAEALDPSLRTQVWNLLAELRERLGLTYLMVTRNLALARQMCERVGVMYCGRLVEEHDAEGFFGEPAHPYSRALLALARREPDALARWVGLEPPSPLALPAGCSFHPHCPRRAEVGARCAEERPTLVRRERGAAVACHLLDAERP